jgi:predicted metal-dependent HD superfamily phosphohydrolase
VSGDDLELRVAWQRHLGRSPAADRWLGSVIARHREPGRYYHDVRHVAWVVRHVTSFIRAGSVADPAATVAAAFFHDSVYDPAASDNEAASARLAATALAEIGWPDERRNHVADLVNATAHHRVPGPDADHDALIAADLAVLASEPNRYGDYVRAVRHEYSHLSDDEWRVGRTTVLRGLLEHDRLYPERLDLDRWEQRARANVSAELAELAP